MATYDTVQEYVTDARVLLQDTLVPYRYGDDTLIAALNATLLETRRLRADLFFGIMDAIPSYTTAAISDSGPDPTVFVPIEPQFRLAIVHGLAAHAMERDQEDIPDARATDFTRVFTKILTGVDTTPILPRQQ